MFHWPHAYATAVTFESSPRDVPDRPAKPTPADLQAEVAAAREDLVASIDELRRQLSPGALAARGGRALGGWFMSESGGVRPERVAVAGAVLLGVVAITALARRRRT